METHNPNPAAPAKKKMVLRILLLVFVASLGYWVVSKMLYARNHEETDDAQLDADISPVLSRVAGYIESIRFEENQPVTKGDTLITIDRRDLDLKVRQAETQVDIARANEDVATAAVEKARADLHTAETAIDAAKIRLWRSGQDFDRIKNLQQSGAGTAQQFDAAKSEKEAAEIQVITANRQKEAALLQVRTAEQQVHVAHASVLARQADYDFSLLQSSYATVMAPVSGIASKKNIQIGQLVNAGSPLFSIVSDTNVYVTANFKETQVGALKKGQPVDVKVDAYPDRIFQGSVYSFSPATGARFSLLPPDNATGNYVKVVQRIPVRINLLEHEAVGMLHPGMSVRVAVHTD